MHITSRHITSRFSRRISRVSRLLLALLAGALCVPQVLLAQPDVGPRVGVGEIEERRSTTRDRRFRVMLLLFDRPNGTRGLRARIDKAADSGGRDLVLPEQAVSEWNDFDDDEVADVDVSLRNPSRAALKIAEMSGAVEAFVPARDGAATLSIADWRKYLQPESRVEAPVLLENSIALQMMTDEEFRKLPEARRDQIGLNVEDNSLVFLFDDPQGRVVTIQMVNGQGRVIGPDDDDSNRRGIALRFRRLPQDARLRVLIATPASVVAVPFAIANIELP